MFQGTITPASPQPGAAGPPDPDAFQIDENHLLDLTEAIRQYREVATEMQPLCRPDCRGLCPICGADLNAGDCGCNAGAIDARWAGLAELLDESNAAEARNGSSASSESAKGDRVKSRRASSKTGSRPHRLGIERKGKE